MISVIIPTCDRPAEFLSVAIDSALTQSLSPSEVIVVDNGTLDVDTAVIREGVTLYRLPPRVGPSRARNFGAAMARGSHLAFLDDDDWWDTEFLREAWAVLHADDTRCVYGRKDIYRDGRIERYKCPTLENLTIPILLRCNPGTGGQNVVIEKLLFWSIGGFNELLQTSEDKALVIELLRLGEPLSIAPKAATILRTHDGTRLRQSRLRKLKFIWIYRDQFGSFAACAESFKLLRTEVKNRLKTSRKRWLW